MELGSVGFVVDLMILKLLSNLNYAVILWFSCLSVKISFTGGQRGLCSLWGLLWGKIHSSSFSECLLQDLCSKALPSSTASGGRGSTSAFLLQAQLSLFWQNPTWWLYKCFTFLSTRRAKLNFHMLSILIFPKSVTEQISRMFFFLWKHSHFSDCGTAGFSHPRWRLQLRLWYCVREQPHQISTIPHIFLECIPPGSSWREGTFLYGQRSHLEPYFVELWLHPVSVRQCRLGSQIPLWNHSPSARSHISSSHHLTPQKLSRGNNSPPPQPLAVFKAMTWSGKGCILFQCTQTSILDGMCL